jgi:hypothetical protein
MPDQQVQNQQQYNNKTYEIEPFSGNVVLDKPGNNIKTDGGVQQDQNDPHWQAVHGIKVSFFHITFVDSQTPMNEPS